MGAERDESGAGAAVLVPLLGSRSNRPARPAEKMAVAGSGWSLARLAEALGSSEQALRLIVSILMGAGPSRPSLSTVFYLEKSCLQVSMEDTGVLSTMLTEF